MEIIIPNIKNIPNTGNGGVLKIGENLRIKVNSSHERIFRTYSDKTQQKYRISFYLMMINCT